MLLSDGQHVASYWSSQKKCCVLVPSWFYYPNISRFLKRSPWHLSMLYCSNSGVAVFVSIDFYRDDYFLWTIFVILNIEFHEITLCYTLEKNLLANNLEILETSLNNLFNKISGIHFLLLLLDRNAFQRLYALSLTVYRTRIML